MIRATTPLHTFMFDEDPSEYARILITYSQGNNIVLEKEKDDLILDQDPDEDGKYSASFRMTQEETKQFLASPGKLVYVQVRVLTQAGEALASAKSQILVQDVLNDEVLS